MNLADQSNVIRATATGAVLFVLYIALNASGMLSNGPVPQAAYHAVALIVGLGLMAWANAASGEKRQAPVELSTRHDLKDVVRLLGLTIDSSDPFGGGRNHRFRHFSLALGRKLGMSGAGLEDLEYAAMLHDLGRVNASHETLYKPGRLNDAERDSVRSHPRIGYELLKQISPLEGAAEIIYAHHEQPDGKGYPRGLKSVDIPLGSAVIMVVAAFDAMTSERPYRAGLSPAEAYDELRRESGKMFVAKVVDAFIELHRSGEIFEEFDNDEIEKYAAGEYGSRALEDFLKARKERGGDSRGKEHRHENPAA